MYKFGICGKANSGKDTVSNIILNYNNLNSVKLSFADVIKKIGLMMFPDVPKECFFGESSLRNTIIEGAFKDNKPLTVRQLLIDLGTDVGRKYNKDIWINALISDLNRNYSNTDCAVISDVRFQNEFFALKKDNFILIKIIRDNCSNINHISELEQESIPNNLFDHIIYNNGSIEELEENVKNILKNIII
jgi:hypothetical protein